MIALRKPLFSSSAFWGRASAVVALATVLVFAGCKSNTATTPATTTAAADPNGPDPALANLDGQSGAVLGQSDAYQPQQSGETTPQQAAPANGAPVADDYNATDNSYDQTDPNSEQVVTSDQAPPPLPEYDQPPAPEPDYLWTPGYWGWGDDGYYWIPGEWVPPPYYGALWTPPYWGWCSVHYCFHRGYWGPHVGFYGGINYGFGYVGFGYFGGYWRGHDFYYNRSVTNVGSGVRNFYERPVVVNNVHYDARPSNRVSYNGGRGGINVQPRPAEVAAMRESHERPVAAQVATRQQAAKNPQFAFNQNHGRPQTVAFSKPAGTPPHIAEAPSNRGTPTNRPIAPTPGNRPGMTNPGNRPGNANPGNRPGAPNNNQPQRNTPQQPQQRNNVQPRPATQPGNESHISQPQHVAPTPRPQPQPQRTQPAPRPQPQPQRAAPTPRPQPQPQRAAPAPRPQPQPQRAAPAPAPRPQPEPQRAAPAPRPAAPAPHPEAPRPAAPAEHPR